MAYATSNPPIRVAGGSGGGMSLWLYSSTDAATVVRVSGYITNGDALGMKVGDVVIQGSSDGSVGHIYNVVSVTAGGAADLNNGTAITATDSD